MAKNFVTVRRRNYYVKKGKLEIRFKKINAISEIEGLEQLTNLQELVLDHNKIKEIKGLNALTQLRQLDLRFNEITEIKGLKQLSNLQKLFLKGNPIRTDEKYLIDRSAQEIVKYCQGTTRQLYEPVISPVEVASPPMTDVASLPIITSTTPNTCKSCGFSLEGDIMFCPNCGVDITTGIKPSTPMNMCPSCGLPQEEDMIFCPSCGTSLGT